MSKDLQFRACEEIDRRACRRDKVTMPPVRGGHDPVMHVLLALRRVAS